MRQPVPFGKYLLLDRISVGGMAEVFKAKSYGVEGFEKIIAIKRILPTMGEDRDFIKMFIDEAKIAGQLAHANICQIFELGRIDGSHFIAMEYIWGKDLLQIQNRLRKLKQPMPAPMACFTIAKVLEGLDYAHRKRDPLGRPLEIVHRDCSPQNVLVSYEGEVKVIDFGIAKATSRNSRTMAGVLKGKFGYMSPEQVRGLPLDRRSDLFALGTMLYECLTGERLFQGETDFSTLEKVRNVDIQRPREINPSIPEMVERVILKALAKDVDDRYQWCSEMLADLQQYLMGQDVVFTAKSLSSWLKEVFSAEIERERQQLEQYKRVGRDGLIAGVPAAEAKLDVVETLGEAPPAEGDPTVLGEPTFDDLERAVAAGAAPEVGPAPGSPAARGHDDHEGDFGEEAPTEIFGEIDSNVVPASVVPPPGPASMPRAAIGSAPPKPPPRPGTNRTPAPALVNGVGAAFMPQGPGGAPGAATPRPDLYQPAHASPASGYPAQGYPGMHGTPGPSPMGSNPPSIPPPGQGQAKTLLGAAAPVGLPNYANYTPQAISAQQAAVQPGYPGPNPSQPPMPAMLGNPSSPNMMAHGAPPMHGMGPHGMPHAGMPGMGSIPPGMNPGAPPMMMPPMGPPSQPQPVYGMPNMPGTAMTAPAPALDAPLPPEGRRRSSIVRDVAIGVAIAGVVLGGFLAFKYLVWDPSNADEEVATETTPGNLILSMPGVTGASLFINGEKHANAVGDGAKLPITAGKYVLKIQREGVTDKVCTEEVTIVAGQSVTMVCNLEPAAAGTGSAGAGSASAGAGSAGAGSGEPQVAADDKSKTSADDKTVARADQPPADKAAADKAAADKAAADKAAADKAAADKAAADKTKLATDKTAADKAAADKAKADKIAADKAAADKAKADKLKKDKLPPEDNPADRALAAPSKGWVQLTSRPSAKILVNNTDTGLSTPVTGRALSLPAGRHKITFQIGSNKYSYPIVVKAGETVTLDKQLD